MRRTILTLVLAATAAFVFVLASPSHVEAAPVGGASGPLNPARNALAVDPSCNSTISVPTADPIVGTTVTVVQRLAGSRSWDLQNKSATTDCYALDGPAPLTTTGTTGWYIPAGDYRPWGIAHGAAIGPLQIACKAVGTTVHVEQCK
jgi:hypothetical protein